MFVVFDRPRCAWVELDIIIPRRFASSGGRIAPVGVLWVLGARCSSVQGSGGGWAEGGGQRVVCAECRVPRNTSCDEKRVRTGSLPSGSPVYPTTVYQTARVSSSSSSSPSRWTDECGLPPRTAPIPFDWRSAIGASLDRGIQSRGIDCAGALEQTASSVRVGFFPCEFDLPGGLARARSRAPAGRLHTEFG